jgi:hypothetical protein
MTHDTALGRTPGQDNPTPPPSSRWRRVTHRALAVLLALWALVMGVFGLVEIVVMWLPSATLADLFGEPGTTTGDPAYYSEHRAHFFLIGPLAWAMLVFSAVQVRRPERHVASMAALLVIAAASLVAFGLTGSLLSWVVEEWLWVLMAVALAVLHPARSLLFARARHDRSMLVLAALAAVPWLGYALVNASRQLTRGGGDGGGEEFWAASAVAGVALVAAALVGAGDRPGWRLPAWYAALVSALVGAHALAFPGAPSGLWPFAAVASVGWGIAFAGAIVLRGRRLRAA